jgi:Family of unknown function (DUF5677)
MDQSSDLAPIDPEAASAIEFGQRLLDAAIDLVGNAKVEGLDGQWGRHPHVVALTLLCRCISNFRASLRLVQDRQVLEARALVRLLYENVIWLNMIKIRGAEFIAEMIKDETANRESLAKLCMELTGQRGGNVNSPDALKVRSIIKELRAQHPMAKQLEAKAVADEGGLGMIYYEYKRVSFDAVHCSVFALGRHLSREQGDDISELVLSVIPNTPPKEVMDTIVNANRALLLASVGANDLVRCDSSNETLSGLWAEFEANG